MARMRRKFGEVHPGIHWGPFTARIPGIHIGAPLPEVLQGGLLTLATCGAVAPLMMTYFDIPFEVAWTVAIFDYIWVNAGAMFFGEPYIPGWITPAIPLVVALMGGFTPGVEAVHAMAALMICVSAIFFFFGITRLGEKFFRWVPVELRSAVIMGAGIAAFKGEFARMEQYPITLPIVWAVLLMLVFSVWFSKVKSANKTLSAISSMSLVIGLLIAAVVGPLVGEIQFDIKMGFMFPQFGPYLRALSPFSVGWPSWDIYLRVLPLAFVSYILVFGDLLVGDTLLRDADEARQDEKIPIDPIRSHFAVAARNFGHLLTGGVFFPLHGPIWTGPTAFVLQRYKEKKIDSVFEGGCNFTWFATPLCFLAPIVTFMLPLLNIALSITLVLTGFICAFTAMSLVDSATGRGYVLFVGMIIAFFRPEYGIIIGLLLYFLLLAQGKNDAEQAA